LTGYFEAHGTGTPTGDPLEINAISEIFGPERASDLLVGSVKTNIGHLEGASGIAGVIKAVLVVERGIIPPNLWYV
jgi:acyl transferase domain-containing protein